MKAPSSRPNLTPRPSPIAPRVGPKPPKPIKLKPHGGKVDRSAFLYMEPEGDSQCGTCIQFTGDRCLILGKDVKITAQMSCGLYIHGEPKLDHKGKEEALVTPKEAGLVNREVRCENCKFFKARESICDLFKDLTRDHPDRFELNDKVSKTGCCNANTK